MKKAKVWEAEAEVEAHQPSENHIETNISCLNDALIGLIWGQLDQVSQHNFMRASKAVARSESVLTQISRLKIHGGILGKLESFPSRARMRQLCMDTVDTAALLAAALGSANARHKLQGLQELVTKVWRHPGIMRWGLMGVSRRSACQGLTSPLPFSGLPPTRAEWNSGQAV